MFQSDIPVDFDYHQLGGGYGISGSQSAQPSDNLNVFILGWIEYRDDVKCKRRMAFCRRFDTMTNRFVPVDDCDYEHAEEE